MAEGVFLSFRILKEERKEKMTQTNNKKKSTKIILGVAILAVLIVGFAWVYIRFSAKPTAGTKSITIEVVDNNAATTAYNLSTDAEFLRQAMEEAEGLTFSGSESEYGMMIDTVNGIRADYTENQAYWSFYVNDEYCNYGIDTQPVNDQDKFSIVYTPAE